MALTKTRPGFTVYRLRVKSVERAAWIVGFSVTGWRGVRGGPSLNAKTQLKPGTLNNKHQPEC